MFSGVSAFLKIGVLGGCPEWARIKMISANSRPVSALSLDKGSPSEVPGTAASASSGNLIGIIRNASSWESETVLYVGLFVCFGQLCYSIFDI